MPRAEGESLEDYMLRVEEEIKEMQKNAAAAQAITKEFNEKVK